LVQALEVLSIGDRSAAHLDVPHELRKELGFDAGNCDLAVLQQNLTQQLGPRTWHANEEKGPGKVIG
jgi:hypothetical protein